MRGYFEETRLYLSLGQLMEGNSFHTSLRKNMILVPASFCRAKDAARLIELNVQSSGFSPQHYINWAQ